MFKTIVWATDGSELADAALPHVIELARVHTSRIVAVHANELLRGRYAGAGLADEPELCEKIERQVAELRELGFAAEVKVASGTEDVPKLIAKAAQDVAGDLIVVGTHGYGGFKAALAGSVARGLLHEAFCPVLAIPPAHMLVERERERETVGAKS